MKLDALWRAPAFDAEAVAIVIREMQVILNEPERRESIQRSQLRRSKTNTQL